jgi:hypothetical protein
MINKMMAMARDEFSRLEKPALFPLEEETAKVFYFGEEEIGLLDIVLLDGLVNRDTRNQ